MSAVTVYRVSRHNFLEVSDRVAAVYVECFGSEPWNEVFQPRDVIGRMCEVLSFQDSILLVATEREQVLGATLHCPLEYNKEVASFVAPDVAGAMYCEELFVSDACRRSGIGGRLFDVATGISMALGYERLVLRTASDHEDAKRFYMARGYRMVGQMQCHSKKRMRGSVQTVVDSRVVLLNDTRIRGVREHIPLCRPRLYGPLRGGRMGRFRSQACPIPARTGWAISIRGSQCPFLCGGAANATGEPGQDA